MQLSSPTGCFVCLVDPVELPVTTRVRCTMPDGATHTFPERADGVVFEGTGARLLPVGLDLGDGVTLVHATWELISLGRRGDVVELTFATPGTAPGEIRVSGAAITSVSGATPVGETADLLVLEPGGVRCTVALGGGAAAYTDVQDPNGGTS